MNKIKVTNEENKALSLAKEYGIDLESFMEAQNQNGYSVYDDLSPLNDFTPQQFALLLCGWYEVEEPFTVGDWVAFEAYQPVKIGKVEGFDHIDYVKTDIQGGFYGSGTKQHYKSKQLRHATPDEIAQEKERRKWQSIGRKLGEYKTGDIVAHEFKKGLFEVTMHTEDKTLITDDYADTEFKVDPYYLTLVTPIENRFDLKEDA